MINLLVIYGEGGHKSEANQLMDRLENLPVCLYKCSSHEDADFRLQEIRKKTSNASVLFRILPSLLRLKSFKRFCEYNEISHVVSLGPGLAILPIVVCKLLGIETAHVETVCRFRSKSFTGLVLHKVVSHFYVQNSELLAIYKKAIYIGKL
jgi:beta-1,4-N-acetylglucosaminyltransferase